MKINISFEKEAWYHSFNKSSDCFIYIKFTECSYEEFYNWLDKNNERLNNLSSKYNYTWYIGYSDRIIRLVKN